ncbi:uncharacterized protein LOC124700227 isoform X2 [Lolium rigidum]|uniref:uncharacterized protein LOC124700227 isoform X2 n=1 Tax=Lolium rigidum TaxID=89674 RepID=UPI001F5CFD98|nr:uncharacterized protein LOC124700227 isoform X2 [Lolium rigidum]
MEFPMEPVSRCELWQSHRLAPKSSRFLFPRLILLLFPCWSLPIYEGTADTGVDAVVAREDGECSHVGSVEPEQSVMRIVQAIARCGEQEADGQADSAVSTGKMDPQCPGWTKRLRIGTAPPDRTPCASRKSALEKSIRGLRVGRAPPDRTP